MAGASITAESLDRIQEQVGGQIADGTVGSFLREKVYSEKMSSNSDEPVYLLHDFCNIRVPGNVGADHRELVRKVFPDGTEILVSEQHTKKYGKAWDAFLRGEDLRPEGVALEDCPDIPRERIKGLKSAHIRTVEELAELPDASLRRVGHDARALQRAARGYLEKNDKTAKLAADLEATQAELAALRAQLKGAADNVDVTADPPKRRGRPRRIDPE